MAEKQFATTLVGNRYKIAHTVHSIVQESDTPIDGWVKDPRLNPSTNEMKDKWVRIVPALEAFIDDVQWVSNEVEGKRIESLDIYLSDGDWKGVLQLSGTSSKSWQFLKQAENIDFSKPVEFAAKKGYNRETKTETTDFNIIQNKKYVPWAYTNALPNGMPLKEKDSRGKTNSSKQEEWLLDKLNNVIRDLVIEAREAREKISGEEMKSALSSLIPQIKKLAEELKLSDKELFQEINQELPNREVMVEKLEDMNTDEQNKIVDHLTQWLDYQLQQKSAA